ncbi:sialidase family protein [Nakamurella lactea]|uniref:sialidase family protein n=1 Tax=Nakamurella lactea TaxID=459515 RepID=UPI0003FA8DE5|nr:hypothetical protein [Nakamurella lactea]
MPSPLPAALFTGVLLATIVTGVGSGHSGPVAAPHWGTPDCATVTGADGALSFTTDDGATIAPTAGKLTPVAYTHLTALSEPNTLIGFSKGMIQRSTDAGCSWQEIAKLEQNLDAYDVAAGPAGVAYVYGINDQPMFVVHGDRVTDGSAPIAGDGVVGLVVDPQNASHVRAVDKDGRLHDSFDGAQTWRTVGNAPAGSPWAYSAAIDPLDLDHVVLGCSSVSWVTFDGGISWQQPTGLTEGLNGKSVNLFSTAISPLDSSLVWAEGYDSDRAGQGNAVRRIYRSTDGGRSFTGMLDGLDATLINGTDLYPSPTDRDVLYFVYGTWYAGTGTNLYRFDTSMNGRNQRLSFTHNTYDGIDSIVFNPADPRVLYLGLSEVR